MIINCVGHQCKVPCNQEKYFATIKKYFEPKKVIVHHSTGNKRYNAPQATKGIVHQYKQQKVPCTSTSNKRCCAPVQAEKKALCTSTSKNRYCGPVQARTKKYFSPVQAAKWDRALVQAIKSIVHQYKHKLLCTSASNKRYHVPVKATKSIMHQLRQEKVLCTSTSKKRYCASLNQ